MLVDDKEREVIDQPSKGLLSIPTIIISGSTHAKTFDPKPAKGTLLRADVDDDDDADVDFGDLSTFEEILSASFTVASRETPLRLALRLTSLKEVHLLPSQSLLLFLQLQLP